MTWQPRRPSAAIFVSRSVSLAGINRQLINALGCEFPELTLFVFDLSELGSGVSRRPVPLLRAAAEVAIDFGPYFIRRREALRACFARTATALRARNELMRHLAEAYGPFVFTLQTQALVDAKIERTPHFIYTDHAGLVTATYPGHGAHDLWPSVWLAREDAILRKADRIFTMGEHVEAVLRGEYGLDEVECVHSGPNVVPENVEAPRPVERYAPPRILFVGRRWRSKGGPLLLEAFARVRREVPDARLAVVGTSPRISQPGVDVRGLVPLAAMRQAYRDATIFTLPSRAESMGSAFLEAMAFRLPLVGPRLGAIPHFVRDGETGFLFDSDDAGGLAQGLLRLARDPARCKSLGDAGHDLAQREYSWDVVAARVAAGIRSVLAR